MGDGQIHEIRAHLAHAALLSAGGVVREGLVAQEGRVGFRAGESAAAGHPAAVRALFLVRLAEMGRVEAWVVQNLVRGEALGSTHHFVGHFFAAVLLFWGRSQLGTPLVPGLSFHFLSSLFARLGFGLRCSEVFCF